MPNPRFSELPTDEPIETTEYSVMPQSEVVSNETFQEATQEARSRISRKIEDSEAVRVSNEKAQEDLAAIRKKIAEENHAKPVEGVKHRKQWQEDFPNNVENPAGNTLSRRKLEKGDGFLTKILNRLYKNGEKAK